MAERKGKDATHASGDGIGLWIFLSCFTLYALTASPAIGWLDSPEFVAQAATLGVAHSPGHPLPALIGRLLGLIPIGDLAFRVNIASGLCAAGAAALLYGCLRETIIIAAPRASGASRRAIAAALSLAAAFSWALWSNAVRAEVYALQSLLTTGALYALIRYHQSQAPRWILLATFWLGIGLANHHLLALTVVLPAIGFILIPKWRPVRAVYLWSTAVGGLGLAALLYLPVRSLTHPIVNFGAPHTFERLLWTLRGAAFSKSANLNHVSSPVLDAIQVLVAVGSAVTLPLLGFALFGALSARRMPAAKPLIIFLSGIAMLGVGARVLLGFDPEVPDHHAYLVPAILGCYLLAAIGIARCITLALSAERPLPKAPALASAALLLLLPVQLVTQWQESSQARAWASDDVAHWELDDLPQRSILLQAYFQTAFRAWALRSIEDHRPDVAYLDRSFLSYPGMRDETVRAYPELAPIIDAPLAAGVPSPVSLLREADTKRPVLVQMHPNVDQQLARASAPSGAFAAFRGSQEADLRARAALREILSEAAPAEADEARGAVLWHDATRIDHLCIIGQRAWAQAVLNDALVLAPTDIALAEMAQRCGLSRE